VSIDGGYICPDCQSPDERRHAANGIVAAIEREIERRRREGIAPDTYETALVAYAMAVRAGAEVAVAGAQPATDTERAPAVDERSDGLHLRVAITGAFLTGHPLAVRVDSYGALQAALRRRLKGPHWRMEGLRVEGGTFESGGGFTEALPLVIARRDGADLLPWLSAALDGYTGTHANPPAAPASILDATPTSLAIDVYDLGVAVMTAWFDVRAAGGAALDATARTIKQLVWLRPGNEGQPPLAAALQRIAFDTAQQYDEAVDVAAPEEAQAGWLSRATLLPSAPSADHRPLDEQGRLLWLHPIHVLHTREPPRAEARDLAPAFYKDIDLSEGVFAAGIGWSAIAVPPGSGAAATPVRLTELHWAYYALYMEIDRGLLGVLNQQRWSEDAPLRQLEDDARNAFADYLRVMEARARLDSALNALGGDELAIWQTVAEVQRFDAIVQGVERKLDVLQKLAQRRVEQASANRTRRIGDFLGGLTVLTVVTVAVAVIGFFVGSRSDTVGHVWLRVAIVVAAAAISLGVYWLAFVKRIQTGGRQDD
jgi:hypothetical protein